MASVDFLRYLAWYIFKIRNYMLTSPCFILFLAVVLFSLSWIFLAIELTFLRVFMHFRVSNCSKLFL